MKSKGLRWTARSRVVVAALAALAMGAVGLPRAVAADEADEVELPAHFSGLLNDYTPPTAGGPYEMHGKWSLRLREERGTATFSAEMTMETADFANKDPNHDPTQLGPHTHHIRVTDGVIHSDPTDPINRTTQCPTTFKPPVSHGFVVTGSAFVTANGANPPFGNPSAVTICILGGTQKPAVPGAQAFVTFSNFTLTFGKGSPASTHFGTQAINGVVSRCERSDESSDCKVAIVD